MPLTGLRGHRELYQQLLHELRTRPSHAYLFSGPRGVGKSLVAQGLVHGLVCERSPGAEFCCTPDRCPVRQGAGATPSGRGREKIAAQKCDCCAACVQTAIGVHPDVSLVEKAENRTDVLIEQVREMMAQLGFKPSRAPMRLAIFDDAETLNIPGQNALLKTLEEPPGHAIIFVITASERALLDTVRSRLRPVRFPPLAPKDIEEIVTARAKADKGRVHAIARLARGSAARALALVEGAEPPLGELLDAMKRAKRLDFAGASAIAQELFGNRDQAAENFELIARLLEEILCFKLIGADFASASPDDAAVMKEVAAAFTVDGLVRCVEGAVRAQEAVEAMANSRLQAEQLFMTVGQAARGE
jgi:DNA polymerase III subunit delta'